MAKFTLFSFLLLLSFSGFSQTVLKLPQPSPRAILKYTIGVTDVTINYGAPGVKGREVFGKLVPYGQVWRAGANEATTITFSTDVRISQENIPAGTYTLYFLPADSVNWTFILSKQKGLWGTEGYDPKQDQVRLPYGAQPAAFHETFQYTVQDITPTSGFLTLNWANKQVRVPIRVDSHKQTMNLLRQTLSSASPKDWNAYAQAVNYLIQQNADHEQALEWVNKSISLEENFYNTFLKAKLLAQKNEYAEALELNKKAQKLGKKSQEAYQPYATEIEDAAVLWKEKRFAGN
ncbi:DUF2911 domain-containing protein [Rufibacter glacialis]|uniref:DUF2911 domain-containing protein n=1 Tax=Rufibacter glacialis TaxID=1259555 RepID=A0A5M8QHH1_9BACT|nr:DUF2911 domain-containing protein [Rufibacter glacialis]KAA6434216.1 DUF2911 domain-containing protein [Rufibacter glacialis]GGK67828.1 hypothetical protein GCM10011405_14740 [Rufibacter glacialis]